MRNELMVQGAEAVSLFCRLNLHTKKHLPVRSSEMGLLILLVKSETPVTPAIAADFFKVSKPMITTMVTSLIKNEYLIKEPSLEDKRSFILYPTEKAQILVEQTITEYLKTMELLEKKLGSEDYQHLISLLEKANMVLLEEK